MFNCLIFRSLRFNGGGTAVSTRSQAIVAVLLCEDCINLLIFWFMPVQLQKEIKWSLQCLFHSIVKTQIVPGEAVKDMHLHHLVYCFCPCWICWDLRRQGNWTSNTLWITAIWALTYYTELRCQQYPQKPSYQLLESSASLNIWVERGRSTANSSKLKQHFSGENILKG